MSTGTGGKPPRRRGGDLFETLRRWKEADYRIVFGVAVVLALVVARLVAVEIDVGVQCKTLGDDATWVDRVTCMESVQSVAVASRYGGSGSSHADKTYCTSAPGYLLGTDRQAESLALKLVEASEAFFMPGLLCCFIALILGTLLGAASGYFRGGCSRGSCASS